MTNALTQSGTALLAFIAYQNLCLAESVQAAGPDRGDLAGRLATARLGADALTRFTRACDAIPGGQASAQMAIEPIVSPVDEFWAMTRPRVAVERLLRVLVVASLELELVQVAEENIPEEAWEVAAPDSGLWRAIDLGAGAVAGALADARNADELSLYARRALGEAAVLGQRLLVRQPGLRWALSASDDQDLTSSTVVLDEVLAGVAARLGQQGLAV